MDFVKGQKIICVKDDLCDYISKNNIYEVIIFDEQNSSVCIENQTRGVCWYKAELFKTIIQSFDDVVVGMKLTYNGSHPNSTLNVGSVVTVREINDNRCRPIKINGGKGWLYDLEHFKEYQPNLKTKDEREEYEVIKPFTVFNIWESQRDKTCEEFLNAWQRLLFDLTKSEDYQNRPFNLAFVYFREECVPPVMWYYRKELCKRGFIKKKEKDIILVPGMRLKESQYSNSYTVVESGDKNRFNKICLVGDGHKDTDFKPYVFGFGEVFHKGITLKELRNITDYDFKIINS